MSKGKQFLDKYIEFNYGHDRVSLDNTPIMIKNDTLSERIKKVAGQKFTKDGLPILQLETLNYHSVDITGARYSGVNDGLTPMQSDQRLFKLLSENAAKEGNHGVVYYARGISSLPYGQHDTIGRVWVMGAYEIMREQGNLFGIPDPNLERVAKYTKSGLPIIDRALAKRFVDEVKRNSETNPLQYIADVQAEIIDENPVFAYWLGIMAPIGIPQAVAIAGLYKLHKVQAQTNMRKLAELPADEKRMPAVSAKSFDVGSYFERNYTNPPNCPKERDTQAEFEKKHGAVLSLMDRIEGRKFTNEGLPILQIETNSDCLDTLVEAYPRFMHGDSTGFSDITKKRLAKDGNLGIVDYILSMSSLPEDNHDPYCLFWVMGAYEMLRRQGMMFHTTPNPDSLGRVVAYTPEGLPIIDRDMAKQFAEQVKRDSSANPEQYTLDAEAEIVKDPNPVFAWWLSSLRQLGMPTAVAVAGLYKLHKAQSKINLIRLAELPELRRTENKKPQ